MLWTRPIATAGAAFLLGSAASAETPLTAGIILEEMSSEQRFAYIAGVVEGLAHQAPEEATGACLFRWFYEGDGNASAKILAAFERYPNHRAAPIILALSKSKCGGS